MGLKTFLISLFEDVRGTSAVELGLICALIILAMLSALEGFAGASIKQWNHIKTESDRSINGTSSG